MRLTEHARPLLPVLPVEARDYRAPGTHVSTIIKDLCLTLDPLRFTKEGSEEFQDLELEPRVWLGQAMDTHLSQVLTAYTQTAVRPGGIEVDGVWMSSDLLVLADDPSSADFVVEEFKLTWMSSRGGVDQPKFIHWLWQIKAYCWAWETVHARLRVYFVNGDYQYPLKPQYRVWDLEFTFEELQNNWRMLLGHAKKRGMV